MLPAAGIHGLISHFAAFAQAPLSPNITSRPIKQTAAAFAQQKPVGIHPSRSTHIARSSIPKSLRAMPICIIVEAEIKEDRMEEFVDMIEKNAIGSRAEPGCIRFDVLQAEDAPNKFFFYEIYRNSDDISHHKEQPHYLAWVAFKESGGTISSISKKASGKFLT
ncbi:hypothetical protein ACHAW5_006929 [Stephanodiscus triporus]|uniref:ABM domain-containing protein n=1 Tax=Stephanodiscus triporus TaxID=2934178 RepID=A0ABD3MN33_9STRA